MALFSNAVVFIFFSSFRKEGENEFHLPASGGAGAYKPAENTARQQSRPHLTSS